MDTLVRIDGRVQWQCLRTEGGNWIARCTPLKLTLQSATWAELMEDIGLALDALLKDLLKSNDLEKFLREHGWRPVGLMPRRPEKVRFDVPFFPVMM